MAILQLLFENVLPFESKMIILHEIIFCLISYDTLMLLVVGFGEMLVIEPAIKVVEF